MCYTYSTSIKSFIIGVISSLILVLLNSFSTNISGITIPPAKELKNCLLFSCSNLAAASKPFDWCNAKTNNFR